MVHTKKCSGINRNWQLRRRVNFLDSTTMRLKPIGLYTICCFDDSSFSFNGIIIESRKCTPITAQFANLY